MATLKRETVGGATYELKRRRSNQQGQQYEYVVTKNGKRIEGPVDSRRAGIDLFGQIVHRKRDSRSRDREKQERDSESRGRESRRREREEPTGPSLPGFGGGQEQGGAPSLPIFGAGGDDGGSERDRDGGPSLPGFDPPRDGDDGGHDGPHVPGVGMFDDDGGGPSLPGFGPMDTDGDQDSNDDDQPSLPFF